MEDSANVTSSRTEWTTLALRYRQRECTPIALLPSGAARSQVDQEERRGYKMKLQNYHSAMFKCTKRIIHPLRPSCDAQGTAICRQVDQMGHTSQQCLT